MGIVFGGIKELSRIILSGDLDSFLTQPKNVLMHIAGSKSLAKGWGHLMTAVVIIFLSLPMSLSDLGLIVLSILCGCLVFTSINIMAHSLPFWLGAMESVAKRYCDALYLFALYPSNIYSGFLQVVMFTLIPAGVITYLPIQLLQQFSWSQLFVLISVSGSFFACAFGMFFAGLKKYESGNRFGVRL